MKLVTGHDQPVTLLICARTAWVVELNSNERRLQMRKISLFAVVALILAGAGGWVVSSTQARVDTMNVRVDRIDPMQMMTPANDLPTEHYVDYSLVFN